MQDTVVDNELKEEKWGYIRPGFYPLKNYSVVPAMICLSDRPFSKEPRVEFVLIKTDCCLREWQDALLVSEQDYDQAVASCTTEAYHPTQKLENLMDAFVAKGYLPLNKVKSDVQINHLH